MKKAPDRVKSLHKVCTTGREHLQGMYITATKFLLEKNNQIPKEIQKQCEDKVLNISGKYHQVQCSLTILREQFLYIE